MNSKVIVGIIIGIAIIVGISAIYLSSPEEPIFEDVEQDIVSEPEPQGRDITIELHESMGFSTAP